MDTHSVRLAKDLGVLFKSKGEVIVTAESCTGGGIAQTLTEIPGSSAWFDRGFVTYSNASKIQMLGVKPQSLATFGAVSSETATEMALGALKNSSATQAVAVTGIAGPDGGTEEKPVGTVYIAWASIRNEIFCQKFLFSGGRSEVRQQTVIEALKILISNTRL
ncbi:MAG: CinA family protein [Methylicorpusculum sp.]|uniref:CinA family protein n=1 Tax=Methylicorpusculum sp. TaxID=2713644 RepID=UPI002720BB71|nr:CinA family protein [Methylicorpusculum sp.]MDO8843018.1 CinA family protein [Methylicorpusculum sp.]MDO8938987.1 CinA family protein [Methylicorpusculum sp.]MDO9239189.1 CinA family protein [Methylicorpusculum sp.]MDP2178936.1 CinA family protein [Methylicorpusculum sp.]MDP2201809.1 CinA family protein [Methylicorpusculum sp.]